MSATIHTFPPLNELTFRHWTLLIIVGLHLAFFWALNSEMSPDFVRQLIPPITLLPDKAAEEPKPEQREIVKPDLTQQTMPLIPLPEPIPIPEDAPRSENIIETPQVPPQPQAREIRREPVITAPQIDPRIGLSEPSYPASAIRANHEGTVLLSVYVLETGRVGDVRIEQSSGYGKLDESAVREARKWRFRPGLRDGVPVAMWKQVPITFQLRDAERSPILRY